MAERIIKGKTPGSGPSAALLKLEKSLKTKFAKEKVQLSGTKPELEMTVPEKERYEAQAVLLDAVYVKLHILEKSKLKERAGYAAARGTSTEMERMAHVLSCGAKQMETIELGEVLTMATRPQCHLPHTDGVRVLVLGGAGMGKTTAFLKKGPMEWMRGTIWPDVELLFAFPLRQPEVHIAKDLEELLCLKRHGIVRQADREDILEYIHANLHRVCLILDGLDEVNISKCSTFIQNLIKGDDLDGIRLIVTSRPSIPVIELAKEHPFNMRVEVLGFSGDDVTRYVNSVLRPDHAAKVLEQVAASPSLTGYTQTPVNAVNVCMLYRSGVTTLPTTMAAITSAIIRQVIEQNEKKKVERVDVAESLADVSAILLDPVKEMQAFAFKMLVDKVMVFEKKHFDDFQLSQKARNLGVLVACDYDSPNATPQFVFTHLSTHEGLSARHVASSITRSDISWLVWTLGSLTGHLNTFWHFLAAELDADGVDSLICALLVKPQEESGSPKAEARTTQTAIPAHPLTTPMTDTERDSIEDVYVDRLLQHLGNCFNIINPDSLGGPVSPEFLKRYVKSHRLVVQDPPIISNHQDVIQQEKPAPDEATEKDVSELIWFFSASHSELCQLADNLSEHLDIANAERLAERLLKGIVCGSGTLAVQALMPGASELRGRDFLRALLLFWKQRVPRASIRMLYCAIAEFDRLVAANCFPALDHSSATASPHEAEKQLEHVNLQSEEGKQLLLLCCHCYQEYCARHDCTPILPGFGCILEWEGVLDFTASHLTGADCRAIGLVLQSYNSALSKIRLLSCHMDDAGYSQLATGIGSCRKLVSLNLANNRLTDQHSDHMAMVVRNNQVTLRSLATHFNYFTSAGNANLHRFSHLCRGLESLAVGGSKSVDSSTNITTIGTILSSCSQVRYFGLCDYSMDLTCMRRLLDMLSFHQLQSVLLSEVGLTPEQSPAICSLLRQQQHQLTTLTLAENPLTTAFLLQACEALAECTLLKKVDLCKTQLSSSCLSTLASLLYCWPCLEHLIVANNDFRDDDDSALEFAQAIASHSALFIVCMPDRYLVNAELLSVIGAIAEAELVVDFVNYSRKEEQETDSGAD